MTTNKTVLTWVDEAVALCKPDHVLWIDGSDKQADTLRQEAFGTGELIPLNQDKLPGCVLHRSDVNDVAPRRGPHLHLLPEKRRCRPDQ